MNDIPKCPQCGSEYTYFDGSLFVCPDCAHEFHEAEQDAAEEVLVPRDSNGAELFDGDAVTVIKDLHHSFVVDRAVVIAESQCLQLELGES